MENYEQKYKEALEKAQIYRNHLIETGDDTNEIEYIFPELQINEDKKIIEGLIKYLKADMECNPSQCESFYNKSIAWLEKQGELTSPQTNERAWLYLVSDVLTWKDGIGQYLDCPSVQVFAKELCSKYEQKLYNPLIQNGNQYSEEYHVVDNNTKPKFKAGDWVQIDGGHIMKILELKVKDGLYYRILNWCGDENVRKISDIDSIAHLWTINDAKDGDVLATKYFIFIFKNIDNDNGVHYYCHYEISKHEDDNQFGVALPQSLMGRVDNDFTYYSPATKEQRNLLFQKMEEAGYTWDAEKKELKKIEQKPFDYENANIQQKDFASKAEPKFKVGDWVVLYNRHQSIYQVETIENGYYILRHIHGGTVRICVLHDEDIRLWTVEDAKDGDVLYFDNLLVHGNGILIYKDDKSSRYIITKYCSVNEFGFEPNSYVVLNDGYIIPATKEQRDKLEKAMLKAGYTWDTEKKELIKNM